MADTPSEQDTVPCPECGGTAFRLNPNTDTDRDPDEQVYVYRCGDCGERWDFVGDEELGQE